MDETELGTGARERLEQELDRAREQRHRMAAELGGEDPHDADLGGRGDEAFQLEGSTTCPGSTSASTSSNGCSPVPVRWTPRSV